MKKLLLIPIMAILLVNAAFAISMTVGLPSEAATDSTFNANLVVTGASGNYGVMYTLDIAGGCKSAAGNTHIAGGFIDSADTTNTVSIKASPTASTCTFTGDYQFADTTGEQPLTTFPSQSVSITGTAGNQSCTPTTWTPDTATTCSTSTLTQTSNCGTTRVVPGTKTTGCGDCSCTDWANQGCVGTSMRQVRSCTPDVCLSESQFVADAICTSDEEDDGGGFPGGLIIALIVGVIVFFIATRN